MSETIPRLIADGGQSNAEVVINDNAKSLGAVMMYAKHPPSCAGLVWGMYGGNWAGSTIGTLYSSTQTYHDTETLTDASTNYVVAHRTTGAITSATNTTNWNDTGVYGRLHKLTTAGGVVTAAEDWRFLTGGIFDFGAAPSGTVAATDVNITDTGGYYTGNEVETALQEIGAALQSAGKVPAQRYTIELANTTDSDPGAGLVKGNNATFASSTELYIDDSTSDSVDLSTLFASLGASGFIKIQSVTDAGEWAIWKWTATTDQTGYWKFAVTPQASKGTLDDADAVLIEFDADGTAGGAYQPLDSDLTTIAGLTATTDNFLQAKSSAWASRTVAQVTTDLQGTGLVADAVGFRNIPANSQSAAYTTVAADSGKSIDHPSTDANARTFTIDSNANVAYPVGTCITFTNMTANVVTIAITSDTMYLAGAGTTGSRSLAQYGIATARKLTSTTWLISGTGLS
jgi:hypothetical protein